MPEILVPVDGSIHSLKALRIACDLAEKFRGPVALLHVLARGRPADGMLHQPVAKTYPPVLSARLKAAGESTDLPDDLLEAVGFVVLNDAESRVQRRGHEIDRLPIADGDPADEILKAISRINANTVVMGCRGAGASGDGSFGSVSQKVFAGADCTCISVK